jgi:hypothetical protein
VNGIPNKTIANPNPVRLGTNKREELREPPRKTIDPTQLDQALDKKMKLYKELVNAPALNAFCPIWAAFKSLLFSHGSVLHLRVSGLVTNGWITASEVIYLTSPVLQFG